MSSADWVNVQPRPPSDHVLILGLSKSGTTGVFESVRAAQRSAGCSAWTLFEPRNTHALDNLYRLAPSTPVLTKIVMDALGWMRLDVEAFDRRIMTVRDPRDVLVSTLLFRPLIAKVARTLSASALGTFVEALERKERDPHSVSVRELFELQTELGMGPGPEAFMPGPLQRQAELLADHPFHVLRYEQFVRGELDELSAYLGYPVTVAYEPSSPVTGHISRSRSSGAFKHWFRQDDLRYFNDMFAPYLPRLGYSGEVELAAEPVIGPRESSEYVRSRFPERRDQLEAASAARKLEWSPAAITTRDQAGELSERAANGDPDACLRLAQVARAGQVDGLGEKDALHWARAAATLGSLAGVRLAVELIERVQGHDPALHRELRAWHAELRVRSESVAHARAQRLEDELARVRRSTRFRVGSRLVDVARDPRRSGPHAVRDLVRLWRRRRRDA